MARSAPDPSSSVWPLEDVMRTVIGTVGWTHTERPPEEPGGGPVTRPGRATPASLWAPAGGSSMGTWRTPARGADMEHDPREPTGDFSYDMAHEVTGTRPQEQAQEPAPPGDGGGDLGYDEAHDFRR